MPEILNRHDTLSYIEIYSYFGTLFQLEKLFLPDALSTSELLLHYDTLTNLERFFLLIRFALKKLFVGKTTRSNILSTILLFGSLISIEILKLLDTLNYYEKKFSF